ncbi:hypothetical protein SKAU_G00104500 [Synaphobranchus kaupii]|uniref:Uncharacterized protein n=1 Tax=Synaphobranchus kaupii TaxID=118154 RepID=A0A9Q1FZF4_SYNKA|nr:hypothetical protein SKAU_G00104500 [Synaphobranchus kaupii]
MRWNRCSRETSGAGFQWGDLRSTYSRPPPHLVLLRPSQAQAVACLAHKLESELPLRQGLRVMETHGNFALVQERRLLSVKRNSGEGRFLVRLGGRLAPAAGLIG